MGYVYKFTHIDTGMYYIGSHNGKKKNYSGSGLIWQRAKVKYGIDSFTKELLYEGDFYREEEERILKELDAANDPLSYNIKNEALGGSFHGEKNGMFGKKLTEEHKYKCGNGFRGKKRPDHSEKMKGENNPAFGKSEHAYGIIEWAKNNEGKTYDEIHGEEKSKILRNKLSKSQRGKKHNLAQKQCPHCLLVGSGPNMSRYHFNNCKKYIQEHSL
jgi:hypothetical protein